MEFAFSQQALQSGANILNSKLEQVDYQHIRKYFDISNSYLLEKIALILFQLPLKEAKIQVTQILLNHNVQK